MAGKKEVIGVVRRDKLDKGVVVAVERRVRNAAYGKIQRRTCHNRVLQGIRFRQKPHGRRARKSQPGPLCSSTVV